MTDKRYTFDVMMFATVHVMAASEAEARRTLDAFKAVGPIGTIDGVEVGEISVSDSDPELIED